jgi:RNA polymerase sigma-70 factor, ECF subfamily
MPAREEVTALLSRLRKGDGAAAKGLIPLVYEELRRIARQLMCEERPDHTLEATALVHEAYFHLIGPGAASWENRAHFFGVAARLMRWILLDHARKRAAAKRDGGRRVEFTSAITPAYEPSTNVLALDEALDRLERLDPRQARIIELRYFAGLDIKETAEVLRVSPATVKRDWVMARAWLKHELRERTG